MHLNFHSFSYIYTVCCWVCKEAKVILPHTIEETNWKELGQTPRIVFCQSHLAEWALQRADDEAHSKANSLRSKESLLYKTSLQPQNEDHRISHDCGLGRTARRAQQNSPCAVLHHESCSASKCNHPTWPKGCSLCFCGSSPIPQKQKGLAAPKDYCNDLVCWAFF